MVLGINESMVVYGFLFVFSIGLLVISFLSYKNSKNVKLIFISGIFFILAIKALTLSLSLFINLPSFILSIPFLSIFDFLIIMLLFIATLKR